MPGVRGNGPPLGIPGTGLVPGGLAGAMLALKPSFLFPLNETSGEPVDISGFSVGSTLTGSPAQSASGGPKPGLGMITLNGTSQQLSFDRGCAGSKYTLVMHMRTTDTVGTVASSRSFGNARGLSVLMGGSPAGAAPAAGALAIGGSCDGCWWGRITTATVNDGNWHQIVARMIATKNVNFTSAMFELFLDGVPFTTGDSQYSSFPAPMGGGPWTFGKNPYDGSGVGYLGPVDFSMIGGYDYDLTNAQIAALTKAAQ